MEIIRQPLTIKEITERLERDTTYIKGVVPYDVRFAIEYDFGKVLDELSTKLVGAPIMRDMNYECVGVENNGLTLLIEVSGDVSLLLGEE